ncbi:hypothetical protein GCM10025864_10030 [Luteimicrobium album]|uniref:Nucleotidyl transferase AbiEii/AbiGii toxin family protein n=1 Tax=Luteimicrobium album TaxID=1054550 RepID=A0ABQ6HXK4_9MICO|nr:hypothetical protein [Luteimicrobium album]GMA23244.1 hypothetical protein GCM10025864_10030 [Luteimicrobium album]
MVSEEGRAASGREGDDRFDDLLDSAARLQELVPDAVLVGGSAAALYARHRFSLDHDHVVANLRDRFDTVLEALEREGDWVTNRVTPGKIILGELGGIESGVRQLIRTRPLEVETVRLRSGRPLRVPTMDETLRIKAFLIVKRNQARDYLDVAALADAAGLEHAAAVLTEIDDYYTDGVHDEAPVASQLVAQLADPRPRDSTVVRSFASYKGVAPKWQRWDNVVATCQALADLMEGAR